MNEFKKQITEALKSQKEIFGDELFFQNTPKRQTTIVTKVASGEDNSALLFNEGGDWEKAGSLEELDKLINKCTRCPLHKSRTNFVFGVGNPNADVMVVGDGPGADEYVQKKPLLNH